MMRSPEDSCQERMVAGHVVGGGGEIDHDLVGVPGEAGLEPVRHVGDEGVGADARDVEGPQGRLAARRVRTDEDGRFRHRGTGSEKPPESLAQVPAVRPVVARPEGKAKHEPALPLLLAEFHQGPDGLEGRAVPAGRHEDAEGRGIAARPRLREDRLGDVGRVPRPVGEVETHREGPLAEGKGRGQGAKRLEFRGSAFRITRPREAPGHRVGHEFDLDGQSGGDGRAGQEMAEFLGELFRAQHDRQL